MFWKKKDQSAGKCASLSVQTGQNQGLGGFLNSGQDSQNQLRLYGSLRESIPIIDAAILKLIRLSGGFRVRSVEAKAQDSLELFLRQVDTGRGQRGIQSFLDAYLDSCFTYGRGVGEIVLSEDGTEIAAVLCANPLDITVREGENPLEYYLCQAGLGGNPFPYQDLLLFTPFQPEVQHPYGVSLLRSMPFLAEILMKIYAAMGKNWERMGNLRFAVVSKDSQQDAEERCEMMAREWSRAMESSVHGAVRDFVAVGDLDIKVIGADNQILDSEVPVRQILEQLVARTGIPPFMLGLSWSTTEKMSAQQADILTSELTAVRRSLEPTIRRICGLWLNLKGFTGEVEILWDDINLQDEVELAKADYYKAQAWEKWSNLPEKAED